MLLSPLLISPSAAFWTEAAGALLSSKLWSAADRSHPQDWSALRVVVPSFAHARQLQAAMARQLDGAFIPPRITTLSAWFKLLPPDSAAAAANGNERLMVLYAELRQHAWLKKLFTARRNTDLLPLAQTLLTLCDELTQCLLPTLQLTPAAIEQRWQAALEQLSPTARSLLSDEAQLVWSIWKSQLDGNDACVIRFRQMLRLAECADAPLMWVAPIEPDAFEQAFLSAYGARQTVQPVMLDWRAAALDAAYALAWREMAADGAESMIAESAVATPPGLSLCAAASLEQEAVQGAQTILNWLQEGKSRIAVVAQDRVAARRMRALLERAHVFVADDTGWKLSTTRSASALAAWFDVVAARGETVALLDLLKSPFLFGGLADKSEQVMLIEVALRSANVLGGWDAVARAVAASAAARATMSGIARQAALFAGRKTLSAWSEATSGALDALGMREPLAADAAGSQVIALLDTIAQDCRALAAAFSFAEWRAFISVQLESTTFIPPTVDHRVEMMPLNGARLRSFDAVLVVGADADHLPSQLNETLFFANAVRRELGLATRESRQRQQLRDFTELLSFNREVVLSWQASKGGEPNPVSTWIERLELVLEHAGAKKIRVHQVSIAPQNLRAAPPIRPAPVAPQLLPEKLSASGYNSFVACPYQFFATRMLGLSGLDELSDMPQKRDYGDWLHRILHLYHAGIRDSPCAPDQRLTLLLNISADVFGEALDRNAAALGYYMRWQKAIPAYLAWADQREADGWRFVIGEQRFEKSLSWPEGEIKLQGRIDRIDENETGERAVLDYKTKNVQALRDKLKQGEDHQLAFYGLLSDAPVSAAHFVALEPMKDKTGDAEAARYDEWQQMLEQQIVFNMRAITQGVCLPANGIESICQYCDVRGLCRKGAW